MKCHANCKLSNYIEKKFQQKYNFLFWLTTHLGISFLHHKQDASTIVSTIKTINESDVIQIIFTSILMQFQYYSIFFFLLFIHTLQNITIEFFITVIEICLAIC
jgi:hypothetical protein